MSSHINCIIFGNNLNIRSLSARLPSLIYLLSAQKCSVAILSETWIILSRYMNIPSFRIHRSDRLDGSTRDNFYKHKIDVLGVEIVLDSQPPLEIWSCYIPSSSNVPFNIWFSLFSLISRIYISYSPFSTKGILFFFHLSALLILVPLLQVYFKGVASVRCCLKYI
jgi:hypothetical protein